jgi:hypothetical protein
MYFESDSGRQQKSIFEIILNIEIMNPFINIMPMIQQFLQFDN